MLTYHKDGSVPPRDMVLVFGSNLHGIHGAGAAKLAHDMFGAKYGIGSGPQGNSYAIPTKARAWDREPLPATMIRGNVDRFIQYAREHPELRFFVTRIGCGLAGHCDENIAPMFMLAPDNCSFAEQWREYLTDIRFKGDET